MKISDRDAIRILILCVLLLGLSRIAYGRSVHDSPRPNAPTEEKAPSFEELAARAQKAMDTNRVKEAIMLYAQATKLRPDWSEGWWHLGTLLFDAKRFAEARDAFADFVRVEKRQPGPGLGMLGLSEFELRHFNRALPALERATALDLGTNPDFVRTVLYHDAIVNTRLQHPEIALLRLNLIANREAAAHPEAPKDAVFADTELLDALGTAALQIRKLPTELSPSQLPLVRQVGHAQAQVALQDWGAAEEELKHVLAIFGSEPGVHYAYGVILLKENPPLAVEQFRREAEISPTNAAAHIQLALAQPFGVCATGIGKPAQPFHPVRTQVMLCCFLLWTAG